jgi:hypothetical protein
MKKTYFLIVLAVSALFAQAQSTDVNGGGQLTAALPAQVHPGAEFLRHFRIRQRSALPDSDAVNMAPVDNTKLYRESILPASERRTPLSAFSAALTQGTGIVAFTYDGTTAATIAVDQTFSPTWTGKHTFNNSVTASSGLAQGVIFTPTLTAAANNDVLAALDITPTFSTGSFTGVTRTILRGNYSGLGQNTRDAVWLRNTTAATSGTEQYSPAITWTANSWNTSSSISEPLTYRMYLASYSTSYLSYGELNIDVSQGGGAYENQFGLDAYGNIYLPNSYWSYAGVGSSSYDGLVLSTTPAASSGAPSITSARLRFNSSGWNTSTSSAQATDFIIESKPISGSTVTSKLVLSSRIGTGSFTEHFAIGNAGIWYLDGTALAANQLVGANSAGTDMEAKTLNGSSTTGLLVNNATGAINFSNDTTKLQTVANLFPKADARYLKTSTAASTYQPLLGYTAANDANVVHLTGNENIAGTKTFSGQIAIGTTTIPSGYQFAINGSTIVTSITTKAYANWADYVFAPEYKLQPLSEVAHYIRINHHLQDIPTAEEVQKNGQNLGEMNEKLLKKVEELTLYLIEQENKEKEQAKTLQTQEQEIQQLKKQVEVLVSIRKTN